MLCCLGVRGLFFRDIAQNNILIIQFKPNKILTVLWVKTGQLMKLYFVTGTYGSGKTPCFVYVAEEQDGAKWYVCEGSVNINCTYDEIADGVDVEELQDVDIITAGPIESLEDLERVLEEN